MLIKYKNHKNAKMAEEDEQDQQNCPLKKNVRNSKI